MELIQRVILALCAATVVLMCHPGRVIFATAASTYTAAVYEHAVIIPPERQKAVSREKALKLMDQNLITYEEQARIAKQQGADILVFPEDGIYGMAFQTRDAIFPFLEMIPDPETTYWSPCSDPMRFNNSQVQNRLSCMAKNNHIYIVANMGDKVLCDRQSDRKCPEDGQYQFNTDVAYDRNGLLVTKYHKRHLFYEKQFDVPEAHAKFFDTPFGRFGLLVCFDLMFKEPALALVTQHNVTNVLFPTAWMDALPILSAIGFHSSFGRGLGVNFLGSNIHSPSHRFHGSGIYTPEGVASFYYNNSVSSPAKLLVSEIDIIEKPLIVTDVFPTDLDNPDHIFFTDEMQKEKEFHAYVFHDLFTFRLLEGREGDLKVCYQGICCFLKYEMEEDITGNVPGKDVDLFAFGAFDGLHTYEGQYYFQICSLVRCADAANMTSCGNGTLASSTKFKSLYIMGKFQTMYIYPQVILSSDDQLHLAAADQWNFTSRSHVTKLIESPSGFDVPLLSATLLGRDYSRDSNTTTATSASNNIMTTASTTANDILTATGNPTSNAVPLISHTSDSSHTSTNKTLTSTDSGHMITVNVCFMVVMFVNGMCFL